MNNVSFYMCNANSWLYQLFISGVFYFGFSYILPMVYKDSSPGVIWMHEYLCYFMLAEMLINWACVKWVHSPFQPGDYKLEYGADDDQLLATGFEINLNNLKRTGKESVDIAGHIHANQVSKDYRGGWRCTERGKGFPSLFLCGNSCHFNVHEMKNLLKYTKILQIF